jgi:hypothetical protein
MAQGITIKGKTPQGQNVEVQVDANGVVQVNDTSGSGSGGTSPAAAYGISNIEDAGTYKYFGFEDKDGKWYIMRKTAATKVYQYVSGTSNYSAAWAGRVGQTYGSFATAF